jgi:hypothetical protein
MKPKTKTKSIDLTWSDIEWLLSSVKLRIMQLSSDSRIDESVYWGNVKLHNKLNVLLMEFCKEAYDENLSNKEK